jgi:hypothetical protein
MKRYTETTKWDDPWFLDLSSDTKLFWLYLCDKCDNAGVIDIHERKAAFEMGCDSPVDNMLKELGTRVEQLGAKWHIVGFVKYQFGDVSSNSNLHKSVRSLCHKHALPDPSLTLHDSIMITPSIGIGKGKGKGTVKVKVEYSEQFEALWKLYGLKGNKKAAYAEWQKLNESQKDDATKAIPDYLLETPNRDYRKDFERYLSGHVFEGVLERKAAGCLNIPKNTNGKTYGKPTQVLTTMPTDEQYAASENVERDENGIPIF